MNWEQLAQQLQGTIHRDWMYRTIYATDASVYRKLPTAVALPKSVKDLQLLISFARDKQIALIPRAAGTSLAGQCQPTMGEGTAWTCPRCIKRIS